MYDILNLLEEEAHRINRPEFIDDDPVQFPRRFTDLKDIEIVSLLVSSIAWGNRKMILKDSEKLLTLMDHRPYDYLMDKGYEELPERQNIHRTFFTDNLKRYMRGLREIYTKYGTLESFVVRCGMNDVPFAPWHLAEGLSRHIAMANDGWKDERCIPLNAVKSALKRLNMALRWLVRDDGIVDIGVWKCLKPSQLYIPLDVHVGDVSRSLGLLNRKSNDRKAVEELTGVLRQWRPDDPVYYDFALFGIGVTGKKRFLSV